MTLQEQLNLFRRWDIATSTKLGDIDVPVVEDEDYLFVKKEQEQAEQERWERRTTNSKFAVDMLQRAAIHRLLETNGNVYDNAYLLLWKLVRELKPSKILAGA